MQLISDGKIYNLRRKVIWVVVLLGLALLVKTAYLSSFIEITVTNSNNSPVTVLLTDQNNLKSLKVTKTSTKIKKRVPKGDYEVLVKQSESSNFSIVKTQGLLKTARISVDLAPENSRSYAGNNPSSCMNLLSGYLVSYECGDLFTNIYLHTKATDTQPTLKLQQSHSSIFGKVRGLADTPRGSYALVSTFGDGEGSINSYVLHKVDKSLHSVKQVVLKKLSTNESYSIQSYKAGLLIYNASQNFIYSPQSGTLTSLELPPASNPALGMTNISIRGNNILRLFSSNSAELTGKSEIVGQIDGKTFHSNLKGDYFYLEICGSHKVCLLGNDEVDVFDLSDTTKKLFTITKVKYVAQVDRSLIVVRTHEVLSVDVDRIIGNISYDLGDFKPNSIVVQGENYLLNLTNNKNKKVAILVNPHKSNHDSIDKKIEQLQLTPYVSDVSAYGKYILISPNVGSPVYDPVTRGYTVDKQLAKEAKLSIESAVSKIGFNRNVYSIKYTLIN